MRVAVVGSGISGLACAWLLARPHQVTLFEAAHRLGGHTHTVDVSVAGKALAVDTGFLVFNRATYPNLVALFDHLGITCARSDMSLSVRLMDEDIEWCGSHLASLFAQRRNLVRPAFLGMLRDILRFNRDARRTDTTAATLGEFLAQGRYGKAFRDWYLLPMAGAIWSCPTATMLDYPWHSFARFCTNHGLLQIAGRPAWYTVPGGARRYVERMAADLTDIRLGCAVRQVITSQPLVSSENVTGANVTATQVTQSSAAPAGLAGAADAAVRLVTDSGVEGFDAVVLACHSDQALAMLPDAPTPLHAALGAIGWQTNAAVLHTDRALLPRRESAWAAWNYLAGQGTADGRAVGVSYLINRLQPIDTSEPVMVTLNPPIEPDPSRVLARLSYEHPVFGPASDAAQQTLDRQQGTQGVWFAGAWTGYGFHEDGLRSAIRVARGLGVTPPWTTPA